MPTHIVPTPDPAQWLPGVDSTPLSPSVNLCSFAQPRPTLQGRNPWEITTILGLPSPGAEPLIHFRSLIRWRAWPELLALIMEAGPAEALLGPTLSSRQVSTNQDS